MSFPKVISIRRYPVKSMMGEELNSCFVTEKGLLGDRAYGLIDTSTGKLANAKNPLKWANMFQYRAAFVQPPEVTKPIPPVKITLPSGSTLLSTDNDINENLMISFNRPVKLTTPSSKDVSFEGYIPKEIKELDNPGSIFTRVSPEGTFYDIAMVHLITTSSLNYLKKLLPESRIDASRFRPNIIIDVPDEDGFIENSWVGKTLSVGDNVRLEILQGTKRCVMTTLSQGEFPKDVNILRSILLKNGGCFGVYASITMDGKISAGDQIDIE